MSDALIAQLVRSAVGNGVAPAVAFGVVGVERPMTCWYGGSHRPDGGPIVDARTVFDLASLTKPLTTMTWALRLIEAGQLSWDAPVGDYLRDAGAIGAVPVWRLMNHTSGLPAHRHYYRGLGPTVMRSGRHDKAGQAIRRMVLGTSLEGPPGSRETYSDLGFLALQWVCEAAAGSGMLDAAQRLPGHGPNRLHFRPLPISDSSESYAATEDCPWRGGLLQGEVHDDNCWTLGGVGGHAGSFGRLEDVLLLARAWMHALSGDDGALGISRELVTASLNRRWQHARGTRVLGWDTPTPGASTSGRHFGNKAFGHLGFTGTSLWIDPDADIAMVLLTNRVSPSRTNAAIRPFRPAIHDAVWERIVEGST